MEIYYIDRKTGEKKKEVVAGGRIINWVYNTASGKTLLETIIKRKLLTSLIGHFYNTSYSKKKIAKFIRDFNIDMSEAALELPEQYKDFNDFFTRKLKEDARPISKDKNHLVSPADGRMLAYQNIDIHQLIQVKGQFYSLEELLQDSLLAGQYQGGVCIVVRLNPSDYHRFHFPDSGIPVASKSIRGSYYSVNPLALNKIPQVYCRNYREVTIFKTDNFGEIIYTEVGASCVGSIVQTYKPGKPVAKGQEKGYFKFGGSTVILFVKQGALQIDDDILKNTKNGLETKVLMGERIGITTGAYL
ncbi:phosphatidylserine decarboxylase [Desulfofalx alkaliphila]|uniref:phosphatidylserine decarboxylase n=1 Tax=Desulfofalx alkaliphila TaxID=105483 RepID=UPI0004E17E90|nr:phosphatidylserine decarboxylase [Desulfofalx alkaliphila]